MSRFTAFAILTFISTGSLCQESAAPQQPEQGVVAQSNALIKQGHFEEAIQLLQKESSTEQSLRGAQRELGIAYYRLGQLNEAEKEFRAAMTSDPSDSESIQMLGLTLYRLNRQNDALPYLEKTRQWAAHSNMDVNYVLGRCYISAGHFDEARSAFAAQFGIGPNSGSAHLLLAQMLLREELADAAAIEASKALEITPAIAHAHFALGKIYLAKGDTDRALTEFMSELKINPSYPELHQFMGDLYIRTNRFREAEQALTRALSLDQSNTGPFILMGRLFLSDNDPQTASTYLEHAEKMDPSNFITHYLLAQAYRRMGMKDMAKRELDIVSAMHSNAPLER